MKLHHINIFYCLSFIFTVSIVSDAYATPYTTYDGINLFRGYGDEQCINQYDNKNYNIDYCSAENIEKYRKILKTKKPNFNKKYYLLFANGGNNRQIVIINMKTKEFFPIIQQPYSYTSNSKYGKDTPKFKFSLNSNEICVLGSVMDTKSYFENGISCYKFVGNNTYLRQIECKEDKDITKKDLERFH